MYKEKSDRLIAEAAKSIFTFCRARTNSREEAEDLSQDILLEILRSQGNLRDIKAFYGFMWAVASNVYKNWCKKRKRLIGYGLDENVLDGSVPFTELLENESDLQLLHREIALLTAKYRKVVILYYFNNVKVSAISKSLSITESMVKFLLFKSRKILEEGMSMDRKRGDLSFNPGCLKLALAGGGWPAVVDPTGFEHNLIAQNILLACYYEQCTAEEISLQLGVAVPYLERYVDELCEGGVLTQKSGRYETAVVIFTKDFSLEVAAKTLELQQEMADTIGRFLNERLDDIKAVGFHLGGPDDGLLRWRITQLIIEQAVLEKYKNNLDNVKPMQSEGNRYFALGEEDYHSRYSCMTVGYNNAIGDQIKFLEYFASTFRERIFDFGYFYNHENRVNLIIEIAKGKISGFNENEMLEIAEFIKAGWVKKDDKILSLCIPVYTADEYQQVIFILDTVTDKIAQITREMIKICTDILMQHTPNAKKKEAKELVWLKKHDIAMSGPVEIMLNCGVLRRVSDNEHPATYIVLK